MKVLALAHQYVPVRNAGAETMLHGMLSALARAGHDVHVSLSMQDGPAYVHDGINVWPRQGPKAYHAHHLPADLLIGHLENTQPAAFLGHLNNVPVVLVHHNTFDGSKNALHLHGSRADLVVVNSQWMADDLTQWHRDQGLTQPRTIIMRPLVRRSDYEVEGPRDRVTLVNLKRRAAGGAGAMLSKGGETFWAVAARMPKTRFLGVVGSYGVQAEGDLPNVEIVTHVPSDRMAEQVYARTRVLLMPSSYESWGRAATEATAAGIPVVASPTPGLMENLGDAGIFVDWQDVDGYIRALRNLARPAVYAAACRRAVARAGEHERMRAAEEQLWIAEAERLGSMVGVR